jgi:hypothetical protein
MRYFAKVNSDGVVEDITNVDDSVDKPEKFLADLIGGNWVETFDEDEVEYASVGGFYIAGRNAFTAAQPHDSWSLNTETLIWEPPAPIPADIGPWDWNEETTSWERLK